MNEITDTFLSGTHALQCSSCCMLKRHNSVLKGPIAANLTKQGYNFNIEHTILDDDGKKAGDAYVSNPYVDEPKTILDVTISCPTCPTYICNAAAASNDHYTKLAEKNKHTKYDDLASKLDCRVVAAAFTTYGGWGDDYKKTLVDPYYKKEFKAACKNGESGWAVINDRLRYERHVSAVICRENSRMLSLTLDARCRARAIQRSAPQRSPVADSDTDP